MLQSQLGPLDHPRQCRDGNTVFGSGVFTKSRFIRGYPEKFRGIGEKWIEFFAPVRRKVISGSDQENGGLVPKNWSAKTVPQPPRRSGTSRFCALELHERFALFVSDSFDPASFASRTFTTGWAQFRNDEPKLGEGVGHVSDMALPRTDEFSKGFFTTFLYPSIFKEDPRYYRMGQGAGRNRLIHAMSHIFVANRNSGAEMFNFSEWFGLTSSVALRNLYHPDRLRGFQPAARRVEAGLLLDMGTDIFREFWPEIARKLKIPFVSRDRSQDKDE